MNAADLPAGHVHAARQRAARLSALARQDMSAQEFWPAYLEAVGTAFGARRVLLLALASNRPWQVQGQWPVAAEEQPGDPVRAVELASRVLQESPVLESAARAEAWAGGLALAMRLEASALAQAQAAAVVLWLGEEASGASAQAALLALADLAAAVPATWTRAQRPALAAGHASAAGAQRLYDVLQISMALADETRFMRAALSLCNDLAVRFNAERVSLGWVRGPYVRLAAISHVENFDKRATATRELENAMEEAWTQAVEVAWPAEAGLNLVTRAHETYARTQGCGHLLSVPLRGGEHIVGVLTLERRAAAFAAGEAFELRLFSEACARPLAHLHDADRWFGAKLASALGRWREQLLGPGHVAWKLAGAGAAAALALLTLLPWTYRVETPLVLRSKDLLFMPAPFDGYLRRVNVEVGDSVQPGAVLLELDTRELVLEESMAVADELRHRREAEKNQAVRQLADMQITLARQQQSGSKLELIRHHLGQAQVKAPFAGMVVEGELKKNLGAPVRRGDLLLKLASTGETYLEIEIDQVDVHEVAPGMRGEFAFVGRPDQRFPLVVERVDPVSTMREGRNVFVARARTEVPFQPWWRPGMGGAARLDAGERSLIWIMTHRTVRFLRHVFWL